MLSASIPTSARAVHKRFAFLPASIKSVPEGELITKLFPVDPE
jgi:hypothetical protein